MGSGRVGGEDGLVEGVIWAWFKDLARGARAIGSRQTLYVLRGLGQETQKVLLTHGLKQWFYEGGVLRGWLQPGRKEICRGR